MPNPVAALENDTHELQWDFDVQTDQLTSTRRQDRIIIKKKKKEEKLQNYRLCSAG